MWRWWSPPCSIRVFSTTTQWSLGPWLMPLIYGRRPTPAHPPAPALSSRRWAKCIMTADCREKTARKYILTPCNEFQENILSDHVMLWEIVCTLFHFHSMPVPVSHYWWLCTRYVVVHMMQLYRDCTDYIRVYFKGHQKMLIFPLNVWRRAWKHSQTTEGRHSVYNCTRGSSGFSCHSVVYIMFLNSVPHCRAQHFDIVLVSPKNDEGHSEINCYTFGKTWLIKNPFRLY